MGVFETADAAGEAAGDREADDTHLAECGEILVTVEALGEEDAEEAQEVAEAAQADLDDAYGCEPDTP